MNEPSSPAFPPSAAAEEVLRRWIGLDPHTIGEAAIRRAVRLRMLSAGIDDTPAYVRLLETDRAERDRLVEEVVVAESWFFRDPQVYEHLRQFAAARLADARGPAVLRILSVPCAAGEEPYSIAMTLLDAGVDPGRFRIDAIDVSRVALARASAGRYSANAFRNADGAFRERWFRADGGMAILDERVRACVRFTWGNVLDEAILTQALGAWRGAYDVVFCRNLLIYLTPAARADVERSIDRLLKPDGIVVLGAAEPAILRGGWVPFAAGSTFTLRRASAGDAPLWTGFRDRRPAREEAPRRAAPPQPPSAAVEPPAPARASIRTEPPAAPAPTADAAEDRAAPPTSVADALAAVNRLANERRFSDAIEACEDAVRRFGPAAELFFMTGIVHQTAGQVDLADDCFQKALYLDAGHEDALLALSLSAERRGDLDQAEQYRRSALRALERKAKP